VPSPAVSSSTSVKSPTTKLALEQLQQMHGELAGMHEPLDKQVAAVKTRLGAPHEQHEGAYYWYAWNPGASNAPLGCWQLVVGPTHTIGMTVRSKCGM